MSNLEYPINKLCLYLINIIKFTNIRKSKPGLDHFVKIVIKYNTINFNKDIFFKKILEMIQTSFYQTVFETWNQIFLFKFESKEFYFDTSLLKYIDVIKYFYYS